MESGLDLERLLRQDVDGTFRQRLILLIESYEADVSERMREGLPLDRYRTMEMVLQALTAAKTIAACACAQDGDAAPL